MKKFSAPPMIIILDVLFVVLFILVLETTPNMKLIFPKDIWLKDMVVISLDKNRAMSHWFNFKSSGWETFETFPKSKRKFSFLVGNTDCNKNQLCKNIPSFPNEEKKIYVKGDLYDELSGLITDSCLTFPKQCSNVTYHITKDGTVDKERLKKDHQIFRYILREEK
jgi:hypothetical protein